MITHYFQMNNMALDAYIYAYCLMTSSKPKKYEVPITQISFIPINQNWKGKKKKYHSKHISHKNVHTSKTKAGKDYTPESSAFPREL